MIDETTTIPCNITRDMLFIMFEQFCDEHLYDTKQFLKMFKDRRAIMPIPGTSLLDVVKTNVCYDSNNCIDVRSLAVIVNPIDRKLFKLLAQQIGERFTGKPKSPITLMQYKVLLAYRMAQLGF